MSRIGKDVRPRGGLNYPLR